MAAVTAAAMAAAVAVTSTKPRRPYSPAQPANRSLDTPYPCSHSRNESLTGITTTHHRVKVPGSNMHNPAHKPAATEPAAQPAATEPAQPTKSPLSYYTPGAAVDAIPVNEPVDSHPRPKPTGPCDTVVAETLDNAVALAVTVALQRHSIPSHIDRRKTYGPGSNPLGKVHILVPAEFAQTARPIAQDAIALRNKIRSVLKPD